MNVFTTLWNYLVELAAAHYARLRTTRSFALRP